MKIRMVTDGLPKTVARCTGRVPDEWQVVRTPATTIGVPMLACLVQTLQPADSAPEQMANHIQQAYKMPRYRALALAKKEISR